MDSDIRNQLLKTFEQSSSVLVTSHMKPDDDAIASALVMYDFLKSEFPQKNIELRYSSKPLDRWRYFEHFDEIQWAGDIMDTDVTKFDLVVLLDSSHYDRFTDQPEKLQKLAATKVCIDHHASEAEKFDLLYKKLSPATTYLLYELFYTNKEMAPRVAELFLLGILGDTVQLKYVALDSLDLYSMVEQLLKVAGTTVAELQNKYQPHSEEVQRVLQEMVKNQRFTTVASWPRCTYSYVTRAFVAEHHVPDEVIYQAYKIYTNDWSLNVKDAPWSFLLYPKSNGEVGVSFRSRADGVIVRLIAEQMKVGFGHDRAAGGEFRSSDGSPVQPEDCAQEVLNWLKDHKPTKK